MLTVADEPRSQGGKPAEEASVPAGQDLAVPPPIAAAPPGEASALRIITTPAGIPFEILASAYETPEAKILRSGETPATIERLCPGAYRVRFPAPGLPARSASVQVQERGVTEFQQDFPHGVLKVRSQPIGAEIFCNKRLVGLAPMDVPLLPGAHTIRARWGGRDARPRTVREAGEGGQTMNFDFRPPAMTRSAPRRAAKTEDRPLWKKVGRTLKKFFSDL